MGVRVCTPTGGCRTMPSKSQCGLEAGYGRGTDEKCDHKAMGFIMNKTSNSSPGSSVASPAHTIAFFCTHRGPRSSLMSQVPSVSEARPKAGSLAATVSDKMTQESSTLAISTELLAHLLVL